MSGLGRKPFREGRGVARQPGVSGCGVRRRQNALRRNSRLNGCRRSSRPTSGWSCSFPNGWNYSCWMNRSWSTVRLRNSPGCNCRWWRLAVWCCPSRDRWRACSQTSRCRNESCARSRCRHSSRRWLSLPLPVDDSRDVSTSREWSGRSGSRSDSCSRWSADGGPPKVMDGNSRRPSVRGNIPDIPMPRRGRFIPIPSSRRDSSPIPTRGCTNSRGCAMSNMAIPMCCSSCNIRKGNRDRS